MSPYMVRHSQVDRVRPLLRFEFYGLSHDSLLETPIAHIIFVHNELFMEADFVNVSKILQKKKTGYVDVLLVRRTLCFTEV